MLAKYLFLFLNLLVYLENYLFFVLYVLEVLLDHFLILILKIQFHFLNNLILFLLTTNPLFISSQKQVLSVLCVHEKF